MGSDASKRPPGVAAPVGKPRVRLEQLAFDSVQVEGRVLTPAEFLELPIDQRIQLNVARRLVFRKGQAVVESHEAMRSLLAAAGRN